MAAALKRTWKVSPGILSGEIHHRNIRLQSADNTSAGFTAFASSRFDGVDMKMYTFRFLLSMKARKNELM